MFKPVSQAFNPATLITREFIREVAGRIEDFDEDRKDFEDAVESAHDMADACEGKKMSSPSAQLDLSIHYDELLGAARECVLFLGFCHKNAPLMLAAVKPSSADFKQRLGLIVETFADPAHIEREFADIRQSLFPALAAIGGMFTEKTMQHRHETIYRGDHYGIEVLRDSQIAEQDFNDWVEFNFFRTNRIPLGKFPCSNHVTGLIKRHLRSPGFRRQMLDKLVAAELQNLFPGLSLDGVPTNTAEFERVHTALESHVFSQGQKDATVIHFRNRRPAGP